MTLSFLFAQHEQVKAFDFVTRPRRFAQKLEARAHTGVVRETADLNALTEIVPAVKIGQLGHDGLQGHAMQRVADLRIVWRWK